MHSNTTTDKARQQHDDIIATYADEDFWSLIRAPFAKQDCRQQHVQGVSNVTAHIPPAPPLPIVCLYNEKASHVALDNDGLPVAFDDATRQLRKKARNRRAAATSRFRKQKHIDALLARVAELERENSLMRKKLGQIEHGEAAAPCQGFEASVVTSA